MSKKILGLDIGTNSIGWALINPEENKILGMGSRIIPMGQDILGEFGKGNSVSQTAERTNFRSVRRLRERNLLRRERLHRVLNILGFLPEHYTSEIDFEKHLGKFKKEAEPKLAWKKNGKKKNGKDAFEFLFPELFNEMLDEFKQAQPELLNRKNIKGEEVKIPYDWTLYFLRKKALEKAITKEQLAWLILNFNQKRGYYQLRGEEETTSDNNKKEFVMNLKIVDVEKGEVDTKNNKKTWYSITFENGWKHSYPFSSAPNWLNTEREFIVTEEYDEKTGEIKIVKDNKKDSTEREKRSLSVLPSFEEIDLMSKKDQDKIYKKIKARTELTISNSKKTVGSYIYETLLKNPTQKIRGKLVRTIERNFYKNELKAILEKQIELQPQLFTDDLYNACVRELYKSNEAHQFQLSKRNFVHLFLDDIIFYQRPLRSQKSLISNCSLEYRLFKQKNEDGKEVEINEFLKAIPKSNPYYQEFRVWQWLYNLKIYIKENDVDITKDLLNTNEDWEKMFEFLMSKNEVNHVDILNYLFTPKIKAKFPDAKPKALESEIKKEISKYRWNYVFDDSKDKEDEKSKAYPMNETHYFIRKRLEKVEGVPDNFLTREIEQHLWHIIYSVIEPEEFKKALNSFANRYNLNTDSFVKVFIKFPPFKNDYGTYSEKAIKKLLPLMRLGRYWDENYINEYSKFYFENIHQLIEKLNKKSANISDTQKEKWNKTINEKLYDKLIEFTNADITSFQGLPLYIAQYLVYGKHSEASENKQWKTLQDLENYLQNFKQHSLRNPIVEQVITETLRVVKDIWKHLGNGEENFFDEIHVELGREMKNTADDRKRMTYKILENENTNQRIKLLLMELKNDASIENVREYSPSQQEILKIYEETILNSGIEIPNDIAEILKKFNERDTNKLPSKSEIIRYKLWLEQKYQSPYTGEIIPLSKLFTPAYEIEHIIPQSRYFDDSLSNKVICEAEVNKLKSNQLAYKFIEQYQGTKIQIGNKTVTILNIEPYKKFVNEHYAKNNAKKTKLLLEDIPDKMIERQMNDTRYISKYVAQILSNLVRENENDDGINSKNIIPGNGKITDRLKQDWGLNDVWNTIILPRFERMNRLTNSTNFTTKNKEGHIIPQIPFELSKGFQKKRIDHRHHALDALVVACMTRDHINLLNNQHANSNNSRYDLQHKLRKVEEWIDKNGEKREKFADFKLPWQSFSSDAKTNLENIVVSFKQNLRVINKATNIYQKFENGKKVDKAQKGINWAIRKPLHKDTVYGKVYLLKETKEMAFKNALNKVNELNDTSIIVNKKIRECIKKYFDGSNVNIQNAIKDIYLKDLKKIKVFEIQSATRQGNDLVSIFTDVKSKEKAIEIINKITDTAIQKILINHLLANNNQPEKAFSSEGIEEMNKYILTLNNNKFHQPIYKVRLYEAFGNKYNIGNLGNKQNKYVIAAKGTNLYFAVYKYEEFDKKENKSITKRSFETIPLNIVIERQKQGLTPVPENNNEGHSLLFYLSPEDLVYVSDDNEFNQLKNDINNIYKVVSFTNNRLYVVPLSVASTIVDKVEYTKLNKIELTDQKQNLIKLKVDRLGNISKAKY